MVSESVGNEKGWTVDRERRPYGLRVVLPKRTYVLPWAQFLYAEGAPDRLRAVFSTASTHAANMSRLGPANPESSFPAPAGLRGVLRADSS